MALTDRTKYRLLEMIPGLLIWITFILALGMSFLQPLWVIYFIIVFDLYWMIKVIYLNVFTFMSYRKYKQVSKTKWGKKAEKEKGYDALYHLVIFPTYGDPIGVVRKSLQQVAKSTFPNERIIVVLAMEERDKKHAPIMRAMKKEFGKTFMKFQVTVHPGDIEGEVVGKGSNETWAGREIKKWIDKQGLKYEDIIVSSLDMDTIVHPEYFAYVAYKYLTHPNPTHASYEPVPLFSNNIWDTNPAARVASFSTSFWMLSEQIRPERLLTFSSHSMSFNALVDVDFWQTDVVSEDSRIFLQCFLRYNGDYETVPLYMPIHMDAVMGKNIWETLKNLYKQQRRWAGGSENIPWMIWHYWGNKKIPRKKKAWHIFNQIEGMWSWATAPILIFILGYLPLWVIGDAQAGSALVQNAPFILEDVMQVASLGIVVSMIFATLLMPKKPRRVSAWQYPVIILQWILLPVTMVAFGSIPAIEAQTRLMLGKYLGFNVTPKVRKTS